MASGEHVSGSFEWKEEKEEEKEEEEEDDEEEEEERAGETLQAQRSSFVFLGHRPLYEENPNSK